MKKISVSHLSLLLLLFRSLLFPLLFTISLLFFLVPAFGSESVSDLVNDPHLQRTISSNQITNSQFFERSHSHLHLHSHSHSQSQLQLKSQSSDDFIPFDEQLKIYQSANQEISSLLTEAKLEHETIITYAEFMKVRWAKGKDVKKHLERLRDNQVHHKNTENFVAWFSNGAKRLPEKQKLDESIAPISLIAEYRKNIELNCLLQQARREIFAITLMARFAKECIDEGFSVEKYYMRMIGREGRYKNGAHTEGVGKFIEWIKREQDR